MNKRRRIKCNNIDEAKKKVLELVNKGIPYNDIVQIKFDIGGRIKRFLPGEISKIKNKSSKGELNAPKNEDEIFAEVLTLLDEGLDPLEIIKKKKFPKSIVFDAYNTSNQNNGLVPFPKVFVDLLKDVDRMIFKRKNGSDSDYQFSIKQMDEHLAEMIEAWDLIDKLTMKCLRCDNLSRLVASENIEEVKELLYSNFICKSCYEKNPDPTKEDFEKLKFGGLLGNVRNMSFRPESITTIGQ